MLLPCEDAEGKKKVFKLPMKNTLFLILIFLVSLSSYAQIRFEPGYIINNSGNRTEVLIKNVDWRQNPYRIEYRLSENAEVQKADISDYKEFRVDGYPKYERHVVNIDRSSDNVKSLSLQRGAEFVEETIFLKTLIEGDASLYEYVGSDIERYFYTVNDAAVKQLIFKQYQVGNQRGKNNQFRQQPFNDLKCGDLNEKDVARLDYRKSDLTKYFKRYNACTGSGSVSFEEEAGKGEFFLKVKAGVNYSILEVYKDANMYQSGRNANFDRTVNPRVGVEGEYVMPFNKNKWALFLEASYEQLSVEQEYYLVPELPSYGTSTAKVSYQSVAFPIGLRHYFYLTQNSRIFISGAFNFNYYFNMEGNSNKYFASDHINFTNKSHSVEIGLGYSLNKRYSLEAKYGSGRAVFSDYSLWKTGSSNVYSLMIGYTIF